MNEELVASTARMKTIQDEITDKRKFVDSVPVQLKAIEKVP